ncbi:hypothetical protein LTR53_014371 [Teratosphaeriaceae sp. CCFEE 6253]|nr:hypothetical protein LTR53_014371 [Teratosphaeriaceae sp. CCFEE 6253]
MPRVPAALESERRPFTAEEEAIYARKLGSGSQISPRSLQCFESAQALLARANRLTSAKQSLFAKVERLDLITMQGAKFALIQRHKREHYSTERLVRAKAITFRAGWTQDIIDCELADMPAGALTQTDSDGVTEAVLEVRRAMNHDLAVR